MAVSTKKKKRHEKQQEDDRKLWALKCFLVLL